MIIISIVILNMSMVDLAMVSVMQFASYFVGNPPGDQEVYLFAVQPNKFTLF